MKPKYILITLAAIILITVFYSCKDNPVNPPPVKSPREYTWTVDTLGMPNTFQTLMMSIWGSSENDVYTCGHYSGNSNGKGNLWHYNGKTWEAIDLRKEVGRQGYLQAVHGSSEENVWVVGIQPELDSHYNEIEIPYVIQYDGFNWKKYEIDTKNGIYGIYAVSKYEVWACGAGGLVYHYNNSKWDIDTIKVPMQKNDFFIIYKVIPYKGEIYALGINRTSGSANTQYCFFKEDNELWKTLDSFNDKEHVKFGSLIYSSDKLFTVIEDGVFYWSGKEWKTFIKAPVSITDLSVIERNNMLIAGDFGGIYHFNGDNFKKIYHVNDLLSTDMWANKESVFVVGFKQIGSVQKTLVLHGK